MKKYKGTDLNKWFGLLCTFGLIANIFNDDPIASVLSWGFLGIIFAMHVLWKRDK